MTENRFYQAFGLTIESDLPLPELPPASLMAGEAADVSISLGALPDVDAEWKSFGVCFRANEDTALVEMSAVGRYLVTHGNAIRIDPKPGIDEESLRLFLLGTAFGALLHQRGLYPFHCSAVEHEGESIGFLGISGAGKSTLAAGFHQRGARILSDDVSVLSLNGDNVPAFFPGIPHVKLWADTLERFQIDSEGLPSVRPGQNKYRVRMQEGASQSPVPLKRLYFLKEGHGGVHLLPMENMNKVQALIGNTYRRKILADSRGKVNHFKLCAAIAQTVPMRFLTRTPGEFLVNEMIDVIEKDLQA